MGVDHLQVRLIIDTRQTREGDEPTERYNYEGRNATYHG